jgi:hypothetical protein
MMPEQERRKKHDQAGCFRKPPAKEDLVERATVGRNRSERSNRCTGNGPKQRQDRECHDDAPVDNAISADAEPGQTLSDYEEYECFLPRRAWPDIRISYDKSLQFSQIGSSLI